MTAAPEPAPAPAGKTPKFVLSDGRGSVTAAPEPAPAPAGKTHGKYHIT